MELKEKNTYIEKKTQRNEGSYRYLSTAPLLKDRGA